MPGKSYLSAHQPSINASVQDGTGEYIVKCEELIKNEPVNEGNISLWEGSEAYTIKSEELIIEDELDEEVYLPEIKNEPEEELVSADQDPLEDSPIHSGDCDDYEGAARQSFIRIPAEILKLDDAKTMSGSQKPDSGHAELVTDPKSEDGDILRKALILSDIDSNISSSSYGQTSINYGNLDTTSLVNEAYGSNSVINGSLESLVTTKQYQGFGQRSRCKWCGMAFNQFQKLVAHKKFHEGEKTYKCFLCAKEYIHTEQLKRHMVRHSFIKPYYCEICGEGFNKSLSRKQHVLMHRTEKNSDAR